MSRPKAQHDVVSAMIADNEITSASTPRAERVSGASLVGLWLLIPLALGAMAYAILGIATMLAAPVGVPAESADISWQWWLGLALGLQVVYWMLISPRPFAGLWAIIPVISLIPTFFIARNVLLDRSPRTGSTVARREDSPDEAPWIETVA